MLHMDDLRCIHDLRATIFFALKLSLMIRHRQGIPKHVSFIMDRI